MPKVAPTADRLYGPLTPGFGERVETAVKSIGELKAAAEVMGLSVDQLRKIFAEASVPNFAAIAALARRSRTPLDWLAFALGAQPDRDQSTRKSFSPGEGDAVTIASLSGVGRYTIDATVIMTLNPDSLIEQLAGLQMPGNAMESTIIRDALLIVDRTASRVVDGEIFVLQFGDEFVVRRSQRQPSGGLLLRADNPSYEPMIISEQEATELKVLGQVVWAGGRL